VGDIVDPNRWQPLAFDYFVTQNGIPLGNTIQEFIGTGWQRVKPFALGPEDVDLRAQRNPRATVGDILRRDRPGGHLSTVRGIHPFYDDYPARIIGSRIGQKAWDLAKTYYGPRR
jgi:hypothetical protein